MFAPESMRHDPVMLAEILEVLDPQPGDVVADGTLGLAGHARRFAERIGPTGTLIGTDWDETMLAEARRRLSEFTCRQELVHADYREMPVVLSRLNLCPQGILLDLGLNSAQIEDSTRGIAFSAEGALDMRMDRSRGETAASFLNRASIDEIDSVLHDYGDERWSRAIARAIVARRKDQPLRKTTDLVEAVLAAVPKGARDKRIHPATRTFQAVRVAITRELDRLDEAIEAIAHRLADGGRLAVLSYHSGEDRHVKHAFRRLADTGAFEELTKKPQGPTAEEIGRNPRSRSAKLRVLRKRAE